MYLNNNRTFKLNQLLQEAKMLYHKETVPSEDDSQFI